MNKVVNNSMILVKKYSLYLVILLAASFPLFNGVLFQGHDIYFHLMRIEGIAEGIKCGQFPVHIQPVWYDDYGYACSVFYGDFFLYIPAALRIVGLSLQNAYKAYILLCNIGTIAIAQYSFKGIFKERYIGIFGSVLYTLSVYRLMNLYTRASMGEYTGMMLIPLLAYACYLLLQKSTDKASLKKGTLLLALSMSGILQSHILTGEMSVIMMLLLICICIRRVLKKEVILAGIKAILLTLGISAAFLVPFIDYILTGKFNVNAINGGERVDAYIQHNGAFFAQLGKLFNSAQGENLSKEMGIRGEMAIGVGLGLILSLVLFLILAVVLKEEKKNEDWKTAKIVCFLSIISLWMTTIYFPWDALRHAGVIVRYLVINIQFPWRFSSIATLCLTILWCVEIKIISEKYGKKGRMIALGVALIVTFCSAIFFQGDLIMNAKTIKVGSIEDIDSFVKSGEEYLPTNTSLEELKNQKLVVEEGIVITNYEKKGTNITFDIENTTKIAKNIELPLLYYRGYQAELVEQNGAKSYIEVYNGNNNVTRVGVAPQTSGRINVYFKEPWYWRVSELVSIVTCMLLFLKSCIVKRDNS